MHMTNQVDEDVFKRRFSDEEAEEEEFNAQKLADCQQEVQQAGLIKFNDWEKEFKSKMEGCIKKEYMDRAFQAVMMASKATCLIKRLNGSDERKIFHETLANDPGWDDHKRKAEKWDKRATGTGFLLYPRWNDRGWLVITNNHVIMNEDEANTAEVWFDYNEDISQEKRLEDVSSKMFKVKSLVARSLRTANSKDLTTLDFSVLLLESNDGDNNFLKSHALCFDETARIQANFNKTILKMAGAETVPLIMFSHPHGLAKRLSIGTYPTITKEYPVQHIRHEVGSFPGSSGGNLLFSSVEDSSFQYWYSAFLHYRKGHAVSWQAIGDCMRASLAQGQI